MPDEITYAVSLKFNPTTGLSENQSPPRRVYDTAVTTPVAGGHIQTIGTTEEALQTIADITNFGLGYFHNLDSTNYVRVGKTADWFCRIPPGEYQLIWLEPGITLFAIANSAPVKLYYRIYDR